MSSSPSEDYLVGLLTELRKLPKEIGWVEFKENNGDAEEIGEYLSALSNSAALEGKANAYVVWGIQDQTHAVVGTTFSPTRAKRGNEELENWLLRQLNPRLRFRWYEFLYEGKPVVLLEIPRAAGKPTQFTSGEWIRIGSYRKKLKDYPDIERALWSIFDTTPFESLRALERLQASQVLELLDYAKYFQLLKRPFPTDQSKLIDALAEDRLIVDNGAGTWDITNLGAILFANRLADFPRLARKAIRVVVYEGKNRLKTIRERVGQEGYAVGFEPLIDFLRIILPPNEIIGPALRKDVPMYPELAIRELIANALIHQDFAVTGAGPMVEIFADRMEITNPGLPLVKTERFLDNPPRSRNEALASLMRRAGACEERGSGIDKVVSQTEAYQLPAPIFETPEDSVRVILFAHKSLNEMERADRVRACYLHACLRFVERNPMTNASLRGRFGIEKRNSATASRIIKEAIEDGQIKQFDPAQGKKHAKYLPHWA
ncbi:MAG: ATP-binding protein [Aureliella sp.]